MFKPLACPYLPLAPVTRAIISGDASKELHKSLLMHGIDLIMTESVSSLPSPLSRHADMQLVNVCEGVFVFAPGVSYNTLHSLRISGFELIEGSTRLHGSYPYDVAYNCAIVGKYVFLNPRYTDVRLLEFFKKCGISLLPVKQGYAKCSTCVLSQEAVITADSAINARAVENGIDSLLIEPQKNIVLEGYNYGFIGGCAGLISKDRLAFLGSFNTLTDRLRIGEFLKKHGITPISLTQENLVDLGGLIPLCSV